MASFPESPSWRTHFLSHSCISSSSKNQTYILYVGTLPSDLTVYCVLPATADTDDDLSTPLSRAPPCTQDSYLPFPSTAAHWDFHSNISPLHTWILLNIRLAQQLQAVQAANPTIQEDVQPAKSRSSKRTQETCDPNLQDRRLLITVYHPSNSPGYCTSHAKRQSVQVPVIPKYWITSVLQKSH